MRRQIHILSNDKSPNYEKILWSSKIVTTSSQPRLPSGILKCQRNRGLAFNWILGYTSVSSVSGRINVKLNVSHDYSCRLIYTSCWICRPTAHRGRRVICGRTESNKSVDNLSKSPHYRQPHPMCTALSQPGVRSLARSPESKVYHRGSDRNILNGLTREETPRLSWL